MSGHYEIVFSLFIRDDVPPEILAELRWRLGLTADRVLVIRNGEIDIVAPSKPAG